MKPAFALLAAFALSACGFSPVYAPPSASQLANAGPIKVTEIEGRTGHFLRQELLRTVGHGVPGVKGDATLEVRLNEGIVRLGFAPDQAASRSDYVGTAFWSLTAANGELLANGNAKEAASFNFADAAYGDIAAQSAARERVATLLARSIRDQVIFAASAPPGTVISDEPPLPSNPGTTTSTTTLLPPRPGEQR